MQPSLPPAHFSSGGQPPRRVNGHDGSPATTGHRRDITPPKAEISARIRNTMNRIFATPTKEPASPPNPNRAKISATTKQMTASLNMIERSQDERRDERGNRQ